MSVARPLVAFFLCSLMSATAPASAPTPILDGFTADPSIRVFGDTYYVYPTSDKPNWMTTDFSVWSSKDLITWKKERMILDVTTQLKWANIKAWAPDCIERDGTYFFYFCADGKIGVGTSKSPVGPFTDVLGKPLLDRKADKRITTNTIDPYPFIDDDGQAYIYWSNGGERINAFRLKRDMITLEGDLIDFPVKGRSSGIVVDCREGTVVFKRNGLYYFMWSVDDARSDDYRVAYGTATSPLGPVHIPAEGSLVLKKNGIVKGTGHHSVVNIPGTDRWYVAYHRHAIPVGGGYQRETCLARMEFNPDGSIKPIDPALPAFAPGSIGEPLVNGRGRP
jgi:beta-xylosidase